MDIQPVPDPRFKKDMHLIVLATPEERQILHGALKFENGEG